MNALDALTIICAVGCGLMAGLFFAFSVSIMSALGKVPAKCGIGVMQTINVVIINPIFLFVFLGTAGACVAVLLLCLWRGGGVELWWAFAGAILYLAGSMFVTMRCNVPRNNTLARLNPADTEAESMWREYLRTWTAWNHVRAAASLAATIAFILARSATSRTP